MFEMKSEYYTGIELVDREHKELFRIAQKAFEVFREGYSPQRYQKVGEILVEMRDYTQHHFNDEEVYMEQIQYDGIVEQQKEHRYFIERVDSFNLNHMEDFTTDTIMEILEFLSDWLVHHIMKKDQLIGK